MIGGGSLTVHFPAIPQSRRGHHHHHHQQHQLLQCRVIYKTKSQIQIKSKSGAVVLTKQGHRFISSIANTVDAGETSSINRLIRKFVAASPKSVALNALSHLLSPHSSHYQLSSLALDLYSEITEASWFNWNQTLVAQLVALLYIQERFDEAKTLISEAVSKLSGERDLALFYCNLVESSSKHGSKPGFDECYAHLNELVSNSSSVYIKRQAYKSMIGGLCEMGELREAENVLEGMKTKGIKPSLFEFRSVLYGYGNSGLLDDMQRIISKMESEGLKVDTVCSNMILSSYGDHNALPLMVLWLQKMKDHGIASSIRTYNSVLNSCPTIISMLKEKNSVPLSLVELNQILTKNEALLVKGLIRSSVLNEAMEWSALEGKLDLHGMHLSSAYLITLQWMEEIKIRLNVEKCEIPAEIVVVCGSGKHSNIRGESPVKSLVKEIMVRTESPLRIDRKNIGCFVAKGKAVKTWLC